MRGFPRGPRGLSPAGPAPPQRPSFPPHFPQSLAGPRLQARPVSRQSRGAVRKVSKAAAPRLPSARFGHFRPGALRQVPQSLVGNGCPPAGGAEDPAGPGRRAAGGESGFWEPEFRTGGGSCSSLNWKPVGLLVAAVAGAPREAGGGGPEGVRGRDLGAGPPRRAPGSRQTGAAGAHGRLLPSAGGACSLGVGLPRWLGSLGRGPPGL